MSLGTGKRIRAYIWMELQINEQLIQRVDDLATKGKHPKMTKRSSIFEWRPGIPIMDQSNNEPTPVSKSDDEFGSFHSSDNKEDITGYY